MRTVEFDYGGQHYSALLLCKRTKHMRVAWREGEVPAAFQAGVERHRARPGYLTYKLPLTGSRAAANVVQLATVVQGVRRNGRRKLGRRTADLARMVAVWLGERGLATTYEVVCSHRGDHVDDRHEDLRQAGVTVRHIALFLGEDHARVARIGVADIAICTRGMERRVVLLIEIEETRRGTKPKVVLGDALGPVLADRVDIVASGRDGGGAADQLSLDGTEIWVAFHPREGDDAPRTARLEERLNAALARLREGEAGPERIRLFNVSPESLTDTLLTEMQVKLLGLSRPRLA